MLCLRLILTDILVFILSDPERLNVILITPSRHLLYRAFNAVYGKNWQIWLGWSDLTANLFQMLPSPFLCNRGYPTSRCSSWSWPSAATSDPPTFDYLCSSADEELFNKIVRHSNHILHALLPPPSYASQNYNLRQRTYSLQLPDHPTYLSVILSHVWCIKTVTNNFFIIFFQHVLSCVLSCHLLQ